MEKFYEKFQKSKKNGEKLKEPKKNRASLKEFNHKKVEKPIFKDFSIIILFNIDKVIIVVAVKNPEPSLLFIDKQLVFLEKMKNMFLKISTKSFSILLRSVQNSF